METVRSPAENFARLGLYLENGERYDVGHNGSQIGNQPCAVYSLRSGPLLTPEGERRREEATSARKYTTHNLYTVDAHNMRIYISKRCEIRRWITDPLTFVAMCVLPIHV